VFSVEEGLRDDDVTVMNRLKQPHENNITMGFSRLWKPTDNAFIGSLWDECLNVHWLLSLEYVQDKREQWRAE
jgi:putative transposase